MAKSAPPAAEHARRTAIGNLDAVHLASVDQRGLVHVDGATWSLDWWIGAEDRWHLPADEASVRQELVGSAPVVETRMRVPSGDAVHRAYAARDAAGGSVVVVEVENRSKVPFAVALAVEPRNLDGPAGIRDISSEGTEVRVEGELVLVAARAPGRRVAAAAGDRSVAEVVLGGDAAPEAAVAARCPQARAAAALVFPLAHTATLRVVLPLDGSGPLDVAALPSADQVSSGWRTHARRGARIEVPDRRLQAAIDSNVCHLLLRPHGGAVAAALDLYGFPEEAAATLLGDPDAMGTSNQPGELLLALSSHWTLTRDQAFADAAAPVIARLVALLGRSDASPDLALGAIASGQAAGMLSAAGEDRGAKDLRKAGAAMARSAAAHPPAPAPVGLVPVLGMLQTASSTWTWRSPTDGHETTVAAALLVATRAVLVAEVDGPPPGLALGPTVPSDWFGQGWEVHDLPTGQGTLSYAVRWHGDRPALLWEVVPHGDVPVHLTAPALDPSWSSTEAKGEALLGRVTLPEPEPSKGVTTAVTLDPPPKRPQ